MSQAELPPVLKISLHDIRYFATLLRGVHFVNRATVTVTSRGMTITVEESRTLLGTAFIFSHVFDEYFYRPEHPRYAQNLRDREAHERRQEGLSSQASSFGGQSIHADGDDDSDANNAAFEIPLNILIDCMNIFGTAGGGNALITGGTGNTRDGQAGGAGGVQRWQRAGAESDVDEGELGGRRGKGVASGGEKRTGMRLTYAGAGYPLTLLIAEDATGPTTTCEIATFEPEPQLELNFDNEQLVLRIILKSTWLRDALLELDPSCEKITFLANPPQAAHSSEGYRPARRVREEERRPAFRILADGTFGTTEMDYPNNREVLETFECQRSVKFTYRSGHIMRALKALQSSTMTSLRVDSEGLLSLQFLMPAPNRPRGVTDQEGASFIEFRCLAVDD